MGKYIRSFSTAADQAAAPAVNPAVDWVIEGDTVIYTPYEPPFTGKVKLTYSDGSVYTAACDSNTTLSSGDTRPSGYQYTAVTKAEVGECITVLDSRTLDSSFRYNCPFYQFKSMTNVSLPNSLIKIGQSAFQDCSGLTSVIIPDNVTTIDNYAFQGCKSLTSAVIGSGVTTIGYNAFKDCSGLTEITIPSGVTKLGSISSVSEQFVGCKSLTSVTLPDTLTEIGSGAFKGCISLTSITIPNSVTKLNGFQECSGLTSVTIPSGVTDIGNSAFSFCSSLTSVTIPDTVTSIGDDVFYNCSGLTSVTIPSGVTNIRLSTFNGCTGLTSVTIQVTTPPTLGTNAFANTNNCPIYVPAGSVDAYKAASGWSTYANRIQAIPTT